MKLQNIRGLANHPNSCFLNSVLQLFLNTNLGKLIQTNNESNETLKMLANMITSYHEDRDGPYKVHAFKEHLQKLHPNQYADDKSYDLVELLYRLIDTIGGNFKSLLTGICKVNETCSVCYAFTATMNSFTFVRVGNDWLHEYNGDWFEYEARWVDQVLQDNTKRTVMCPKCGDQKRSHQVQYSDLPMFLMFYAERTQLDKTKSHGYLKFREYFVIYKDKYRLLAVVYHHGTETNGHYTCKVKVSTGYVVHIDDSETEVQASFEYRSRKAILLLYYKL